jgi:hypothetical protein
MKNFAVLCALWMFVTFGPVRLHCDTVNSCRRLVTDVSEECIHLQREGHDTVDLRNFDNPSARRHWVATQHVTFYIFTAVRTWSPEGSFSCSEEPITGLYPEPGGSSRYTQICFFKIHFNIIFQSSPQIAVKGVDIIHEWFPRPRAMKQFALLALLHAGFQQSLSPGIERHNASAHTNGSQRNTGGTSCMTARSNWLIRTNLGWISSISCSSAHIFWTLADTLLFYLRECS